MRINQIRISLLHKKNNEPKYRAFLGLRNVTIDLCRYLRGTSQSALMDSIIKNVKQFGNVFHPCPFKVSANTIGTFIENDSKSAVEGNINWVMLCFILLFQGHLYVKEYVVDDSALPRLMPMGNYELIISIMSNRNGTEALVSHSAFIGRLKPASFRNG